MEKFVSYWQERLSVTLRGTEAVALIAGVFSITAFSVVVLHAFIPGPQPVTAVLVHALSVSLTYSLMVGIAASIYYLFLRIQLAPVELRIWQLWLLSLATYVCGFYLSPVSDMLTGNVKFALHVDLDENDAAFHFLRLLPVWGAISYLFITQLQKKSLEAEIASLQTMNAALDTRARAPEDNRAWVNLQSGKTSYELKTASISHISVDDHYCFVHQVDEDGEGTTRTDVSGPLAKIEAILPDEFIKIHRSHLVNINNIMRISRDGRNYVIVVKDGTALPISRSRLQAVMPIIETRLQSQTP